MMKLYVLFAAATILVGCATPNFGDDTNSDSGTVTPPPGSCKPCLTNADCSGGTCGQLGGDSYCATTCKSSSDCKSGYTCTSISDVSGNQVSACVDVSSNTCGLNPTQPPSSDGGGPPPPPPNNCPGMADPTTSASCHSCSSGSSGCQPNGCYGGWWCNTNTNHCQSPPSNCNGTSADAGSTSIDAGSFTSSITTSGGTESQLFFAVVGDTRPAAEDDTSGYPTTIINTIYQDLNKFSPRPPFVVATGDYQFSNPSGTQSSTQLGYYKTALGYYGGVFFPTMGNHECSGYTASNCGSGNADGITNNYSNFLSMLLGSISSKPYYSINVNAADSSWSAKFVFVAANAWDSTQSSWLSSTLATKTTYTFIMRHESASASTAPGVSPAETIMKSYPYTLSIVGHAHEYYHSSGSREVIIGNGGAPISTSQNYGYAIVQRLSGGNVQVDMYDYSTNTADSSFEFNVTP